MRNHPVVFGLIAALALLQGCSDNEERQSEPDDAPAFLEYRASDDEGSDDALIEGRLAVKAGCVVIEQDAQVVSLAFVEDTATWDGEEQRLEVGDRTFKVGDQVEGRGGVMPGERNPTCREFEVFSVSTDGLSG